MCVYRLSHFEAHFLMISNAENKILLFGTSSQCLWLHPDLLSFLAFRRTLLSWNSWSSKAWSQSLHLHTTQTDPLNWILISLRFQWLCLVDSMIIRQSPVFLFELAPGQGIIACVRMIYVYRILSAATLTSFVWKLFDLPVFIVSLVSWEI